MILTFSRSLSVENVDDEGRAKVLKFSSVVHRGHFELKGKAKEKTNEMPMTDSFTEVMVLYINHLSLVSSHCPCVDIGHLEYMCPGQIKMKHTFTVNVRFLKYQK